MYQDELVKLLQLYVLNEIRLKVNYVNYVDKIKV